jgi:hypothetical protein
MGALPLSVAEIETPVEVEGGFFRPGTLRLIAAGPVGDLFYGDVHLMSVPAASGDAPVELAMPFPGGPVDTERFRLVARDAGGAIEGRLLVERVPRTPLEQEVERKAPRGREEVIVPNAAGAAVVVAVVVTVAAVLYFFWKAIQAVKNLANRGELRTLGTQVSDEATRAAIRAVDPGMSATELIAARRMLRGRPSAP